MMNDQEVRNLILEQRGRVTSYIISKRVHPNDSDDVFYRAVERCRTTFEKKFGTSVFTHFFWLVKSEVSTYHARNGRKKRAAIVYSIDAFEENDKHLGLESKAPRINPDTIYALEQTLEESDLGLVKLLIEGWTQDEIIEHLGITKGALIYKLKKMRARVAECFPELILC